MDEERPRGRVTIVGYDDRYAPDFGRLNREWLEKYFVVDDRDRKYIDHPREAIVDDGGEVFFALIDGEAVGTCAAIRHATETVELAKLAVTESAQGHGIGRLLSETVIAWAREVDARKVILVSSTTLATAVKLYERLGFVHVPFEGDPWYPEADVYMELYL